MPINLIEDRWLPVRRRSGARDWIAPTGITVVADDPATALDFPRPDWNAAVAEFLIGLLAAALHPGDVDEWADRWREPPSPDDLTAALAPLAFAFNLDGEGPRAFQDLDSLENAEGKPVASLLIEAPGENTIKKNSDLFIKRGLVEALSPSYAAAALITLQTYAPSGGAGHRTSLRGGGPLTTLVSPRGVHGVSSSLWATLWSNVPEVEFDALPPPNAPMAEWARVFPWLAPTLTSEKSGTAVIPGDASPLLVFFANPRRIRLEFTAAGDETCALDGPADDLLVREYRTQNYGANYTGWLHSLSPYRDDPKSGKLPLHPRAGPSSWRDWLGWWGFDGKEPEVLRLWVIRARALGLSAIEAEVSVVGFDMDNMKARAWLEQSIPWIDASEEAIRAGIGAFVKGAQEAASALRFQAKIAIYGQGQGLGAKRSWRLPDTVPRDAMSELADSLWAHTERRFRAVVRELAADPSASRKLRESFLPVLRATALRLFDDAVDMDGLFDKDAHRLVVARDFLAKAFLPNGRVASELQIAAAPVTRKSKEPA
jgi:CRISPR system Cascade subunit CasA